uniref:Uncharacterized protein n=1 Tax=Tetranychus urticae TaxID=32264 RepID=T1JSL2_TETUR
MATCGSSMVKVASQGLRLILLLALETGNCDWKNLPVHHHHAIQIICLWKSSANLNLIKPTIQHYLSIVLTHATNVKPNERFNLAQFKWKCKMKVNLLPGSRGTQNAKHVDVDGSINESFRHLLLDLVWVDHVLIGL